jgi:hypothetical protein
VPPGGTQPGHHGAIVAIHRHQSAGVEDQRAHAAVPPAARPSSRSARAISTAVSTTGVGVGVGAAPPARRIVVFDRPYLLLITGTATGEPLFLARVANPDLP